jgi:hypothetical protein
MIKPATKDFDYEKYKGSVDLLEWFTVWYIKRAKQEKCLPLRTMQDNCFYKSPRNSRAGLNSVSGLTLYRQGDLQVQLFIFPPRSRVPPHVHPNMDSFEVYVGGEPFFDIDGYDSSEMHGKLGNFDDLRDKKSFYNKLFLKSFRVTENTVHHAEFGKKGGAFLSIQCWKNGTKPTSPADDWEER